MPGIRELTCGQDNKLVESKGGGSSLSPAGSERHIVQECDALMTSCGEPRTGGEQQLLPREHRTAKTIGGRAETGAGGHPQTS
jgi:hypothetical protein